MGRPALLLLLLGVLLAAPASALAGGRQQAALPVRGLLISGQSLGGISLGDSSADVEATWGTNYKVCDTCTLTTWYFVYPTKPVGAGVVFDKSDQVVAVFTLGTPFGWRTEKGLQLGAEIHDLTAMYPAPQMAWKACIGYSALSQRQGSTVTSIYTQAEVVYGFALTMPGRPVCL
jgi:hypothetical protein